MGPITKEIYVDDSLLKTLEKYKSETGKMGILTCEECINKKDCPKSIHPCYVISYGHITLKFFRREKYYRDVRYFQIPWKEHLMTANYSNGTQYVVNGYHYKVGNAGFTMNQIMPNLVGHIILNEHTKDTEPKGDEIATFANEEPEEDEDESTIPELFFMSKELADLIECHRKAVISKDDAVSDVKIYIERAGLKYTVNMPLMVTDAVVEHKIEYFKLDDKLEKLFPGNDALKVDDLDVYLIPHLFKEEPSDDPSPMDTEKITEDDLSSFMEISPDKGETITETPTETPTETTTETPTETITGTENPLLKKVSYNFLKSLGEGSMPRTHWGPLLYVYLGKFDLQEKDIIIQVVDHIKSTKDMDDLRVSVDEMDNINIRKLISLDGVITGTAEEIVERLKSLMGNGTFKMSYQLDEI